MADAKGYVLTESTLYILAALKRPLHGYGVIKSVEDMTKGRIVLAPGTLYGAIKTLQQSGAIEAVGGPEGSRNKKEYVRTHLGTQMLMSEQKRIKQLLMNIKKSL